MSKLTPRERQIVEAIQQQPSATYKAIGRHMGITRYGAKFHVHNVYEKLGVDSRAGLVQMIERMRQGQRNAD